MSFRRSMKMTGGALLAGAVLCLAADPTYAGLVTNGDGTLTDSQTGLMWVQDGSLAGTVGAYTNGLMTWSQALQFVADVDAGVYQNFGYTDWRLPSALNPDGTLCNSFPSGANCTKSDMGTLYFGDGVIDIGGNAAPFINLLQFYWTGTEFSSAQAMTQDFVDGGQNPLSKGLTLSALLVRDINGQPAVPEPGTISLLGMGVVMLFTNRRKTNCNVSHE